MKKEDFDYEQKGFMNYEEYTAYAYANKKIPLKKALIGDKIEFDKVSFEKFPISKEIFLFLSENSDLITKESLITKCKMLNISITENEIDEMMGFFNDNGNVSMEDFERSNP